MSIRQDELQTYLKAELASRCDRNPRYSLRAFAKFLEIDFSTLSKILRGEVRVGGRLLTRIYDRLGPPMKVRKAIAGEAGSAAARATYRELSEDLFESVAKWYSYAILELTHTESFRADERWIASRLGLTVHQVRESVQSLREVGFLEVTPEGRWTDRSGSYTDSYKPRRSSGALRRFQEEVLSRASDSLQRVSPEHRDQSSLIVAIPPSKLELARKLLADFRVDFDRQMASNEEGKEEVYGLSLSFFPLTQNVKAAHEKESLC